MTRVVSSTNDAELQKQAVAAVVMVELDFVSGKVYAHDGIGQITWNGNTYDGLGKVASLDGVDETLDTVAKSVKLTLAVDDPGLIASARDEVYQNRSALIMLGLVNAATGTVIDTPETVWEGRMDTMPILLDRATGSITLNCEHRLFREPRIARYTDPDQQLAYSGDVFFEFIPNIAGYVSQWGNERARYGGGGGGTIWDRTDPTTIRNKF